MMNFTFYEEVAKAFFLLSNERAGMVIRAISAEILGNEFTDEELSEDDLKIVEMGSGLYAFLTLLKGYISRAIDNTQ
jgi:hypothetical protein